MEEAEASVDSHSPSHKVAVTWNHKLGHMSKQGMNILMERKLLPSLTKVSLPFCEHYVISKQHRLKFKTSNSRSVSVLWGNQRQFTMTYTPQQNEAAEQMNRTLLERARAMLATTSLGKLFWVEAINTECYVINHSPSTVVKLKTPMKMWTRKTSHSFRRALCPHGQVAALEERTGSEKRCGYFFRNDVDEEV
ncbi:gag-pol polyprotein [Tanacetum coccineum]